MKNKCVKSITTLMPAIILLFDQSILAATICYLAALGAIRYSSSEHSYTCVCLENLRRRKIF